MSNPQTYKISKLADIYNLPTLEQVQTACNELAEIIISARLKNDLMAEFIRSNGQEVPDGFVFSFPDEIEWIDDGKGEIDMQLQDHDGKELGSIKWSIK